MLVFVLQLKYLLDYLLVSSILQLIMCSIHPLTTLLLLALLLIMAIIGAQLASLLGDLSLNNGYLLRPDFPST